jgi:hypothetical protein
MSKLLQVSSVVAAITAATAVMSFFSLLVDKRICGNNARDKRGGPKPLLGDSHKRNPPRTTWSEPFERTIPTAQMPQANQQDRSLWGVVITGVY